MFLLTGTLVQPTRLATEVTFSHWLHQLTDLKGAQVQFPEEQVGLRTTSSDQIPVLMAFIQGVITVLVEKECTCFDVAASDRLAVCLIG